MVNVKPVHLGKNVRMSFSRINEVLEMPNLIEVQKNSYKWFLEEGLKEVFKDSPRFQTIRAIWYLTLSITVLTKNPNTPSKSVKSAMQHMQLLCGFVQAS